MTTTPYLNELPERQPVAYADEQLPAEVILIRTGQQVNAWLNICPHQGRPLNYAPNKFLQTPDGYLMCAAHGATFDMQSGICVNGPCKGISLKAVPVAINPHGQLQLNAPEAH